MLDSHGVVRKRRIASEGDLVALGMSAVESRARPAHSNPMPQSWICRQDLSELPPACATTAAVRESCHVRRIAEVDAVDLAETGIEPAKERSSARILNPDEEAVEQARRCTVEHVRDVGSRVRLVPVELKRSCVERSHGSAI